MFTIASANNKFTITVQGDYKAANEGYLYTLSRSMLKVTRVASPQLSVATIYHQDQYGLNTVTNSYYTDTDGVLEIPMKNIVNKYHDQGETMFLVGVGLADLDGTWVDTAILLVCYPLKGLSYNDILAPRNKDAEQFFAAFKQDVVMPPNVILNPTQFAGITAPGIIVETNFTTGETWKQIVNGVATTITPNGERSNQLVIGNTADAISVEDANDKKIYPLTKVDYCTDLACVRWTSQTGAVRQHFFPVVSFIKATDKDVSLVTPGDGFEVLRDTFNGVRCRLTGLTSYGFWYYMDMAMASDVHAIVKPTQSIWLTEITSKETAAYIEGAPTESPQGNDFYTFEFTIKLRHHGQV